MQIKMPKLNLIVIRTMQTDQLVGFYGCMGIEFTEERHGNGPRHFATDLNGFVFELYSAKNPEDVDRTTRLGFSVPDLHGVLNLLRTHDAVIEEPREFPWGLRAVLRDPDGRAVELYTDELRTDVKDVSEERTSIAYYTQRRSYLPSELPILNKHATPLERLLLLLGLNCGFKGAEQGTVLTDHLFLDRPHPNERYLREVAKFETRPDERFLIYSRNKSKVYGEFLLWPQTVEIIQWAVEQRNRFAEEHGLAYRHLLITKAGTLYYRKTGGAKNRSQIFANKWNDLIARIQKSEKDFPYFPFSTLRDTAGDLVRQAVDGEVSATFLMHGQPVKQDDLLDLYTKRPFGKVFEALRRLQVDLKPMFDAAPENVVEQPMQQYTPMNKRERIVELKKTDLTVTQIMAEVGVSRMTVLRTLEKLYYRTKEKTD